MLASILIAAISMVLFFYWFRYTCVLILSTKTSKDYAGEVAAANQLQFLEVQGVLGNAGNGDLTRLELALDRDYRVINFLLRHTADLEFGDASLEQHILRLDFALMRSWYRVSSKVSESAARSALAEMASIVNHMANSFGERVQQGAGA
jgi:hypothetical protein